MNGLGPAQRPVLRPPASTSVQSGCNSRFRRSKSSWSSRSPPSVAGTTLTRWWCPACAPVNWHSTIGSPLVVPRACPRALLLIGLPPPSRPYCPWSSHCGSACRISSSSFSGTLFCTSFLEGPFSQVRTNSRRGCEVVHQRRTVTSVCSWTVLVCSAAAITSRT